MCSETLSQTTNQQLPKQVEAQHRHPIIDEQPLSLKRLLS